MDQVLDQIIALLREQTYGGNMTVPELLQECKDVYSMSTEKFAKAIELLEKGKTIRLISVIREHGSGATVVRLT